MRQVFASIAVTAMLFCSVPAHAADVPKPLHKPPHTPTICHAHPPADYVPGVDAYGRPVVPADAPSATTVVVSTEIYPEIRSNNAQLGGVGLRVHIDGLGEPPKCPTIPAKPMVNGR